MLGKHNRLIFSFVFIFSIFSAQNLFAEVGDSCSNHGHPPLLIKCEGDSSSPFGNGSLTWSDVAHSAGLFLQVIELMTQTERDATTKCETDKQTQLATKMAECMVICTVPENPDLSCGSQFIVSDNKACEAECEWKQYGPLAHIANMPTTYECESSASVIFECNCVGTAEPETF